MNKFLVTKLAIAVTSILGLKASATTTEEIEITNCLDCSDLTSNVENNTAADYDKTYIYTDDTLADGAISFLKEKKIPFGVKYFDKNHTAISIKNKHELTLSTQRWGATVRQSKE